MAFDGFQATKNHKAKDRESQLIRQESEATENPAKAKVFHQKPFQNRPHSLLLSG